MVTSAYRPEDYDEHIWRRPAPGAPEPAGEAPAAPSPSYAGPPRSAPTRPDWRPPTVIAVPHARALPGQDDDKIDQTEAEARTITIGVGMVAGAIALILLAVICGRVIF
jgi:hypothetical protein